MNDIELARDLFETTPKPCSLGDCMNCKYFNKDNICIELKQAESLTARGYQKVKWHKVSESDLPKRGSRVLVYYIEKGFKLYDICYYEYSTKNKFSVFIGNSIYDIDAIAWMEIPTYED